MNSKFSIRVHLHIHIGGGAMDVSAQRELSDWGQWYGVDFLTQAEGWSMECW